MIQGFSGGLLNRQLIYNLDLPSFQRDFASLKTLDHGTGPAITFTRASGATYFDADGVLQTAANDVARFDHSQDGAASSLGLLIEEARTNSLRNSQGGGSTNGVIGSGGAAPTNWTINANANGVTSEVIGTGTENGLAYIDVKVSGTPTANGSVNVGFESTSQVVAANGQTWTLSAFVKLQSGSTANATTSVAVRGRLVGGGAVAGQTSETTITPTSANLNSQRFLATITFSNATVERVWPPLTVSYTEALAIDITLRIAAPQLEQGAFPTSYIPTTTAAATRSADSAVVTPISSFYNPVESTIFSELSGTSVAFDSTILAINDTTQNEQLDQRLAITSVTMRVRVGGVNQASMAGVSPVVAPVASTVYKFVAAYKQDDFAASMDGATVVTDTAGSMPSGLSRMEIGRRDGSGFLTGHIRKLAYWPKRLTNTLLEQLTT
jgi:hypothetical protein